jgi:hypothetical protein
MPGVKCTHGVLPDNLLSKIQMQMQMLLMACTSEVTKSGNMANSVYKLLKVCIWTLRVGYPHL